MIVDRASEFGARFPRDSTRCERATDAMQREDAMPTVLAHHNITKDVKHWLSSPKRKEVFGALGVTNIRTFVDPQNPKRVAM